MGIPGSMKWLQLNSLRKRYAALVVFLAIIMLTLSWYAQNKINKIQQNIEKNIESRNTLLQQNRLIRTAITQSRDLLLTFQIDPKKEENHKVISTTISNAIKHIEKLSSHPWIYENYRSTVYELIHTLNELEQTTKKLIKIRLKPQNLFPSLKIANLEMQPLYSIVNEHLGLAIRGLEDNYSHENHHEYRLLTELRFYWSSLISNFRMYLLNQLNAFQVSSRSSQLDLIRQLHMAIKEKLKEIEVLNKKDLLSFSTIIALEEFHPAALKWIAGFEQVQIINKSDGWRADIILYQTELEPKLEKINTLLHTLDLGIQKFSQKDLTTLSNIAQLQINAIWTADISGLIILTLGFVFLVKLILAPIANVTQALQDESKGLETTLHPTISVLETKNLIHAFKEMRKQINSRQQELEFHALHDSLTGLANRSLLKQRLEQSIHNAQQERNSFAVLIMDLDRFKEVNDTLGHSVGDKLLQHVANRLIELLREVDVVVRLGGDEFSILLPSAQEKQAESIAKKIIKGFHEVFTIDDVPLYIGISIGISVYPQHGITSQILQQRADVAMYVAKRNKTGYEIYNSKYDEYSVGKLALISDLRNAIIQGQLFMEYQPVIDIKNNNIISAEALLRWRHPKHGTIYPDEIIPIAEQTGLINPITYWIIDTTSKYNKKLQSMDINIKIAINLSVYNLQDHKFVEKIIEIFDENQISASNFIMEVTESVMMTNPQQSIEVLNHLHELGIEIAVDDFGTGYSSLAYLKLLPLSKLKIDKSFIIDMIEDENDAMIVRSTIDLAHNLGMEVVAEGIEEKENLELLSMLGCNFGQGYYISRPISKKDLEKWIHQQNDSVNNKNG